MAAPGRRDTILAGGRYPFVPHRCGAACGQRFKFYGLHPAPPNPRYADDTVQRDAELLLVGKEVAPRDEPTIVAGDLNDVAWSHTTALFQKTSHLLDPRIGRGMFNTFHVRYPFFRFPLDHVFVSRHFRLVVLERLPDIGSDHFPVFAHVQYTPQRPPKHPLPELEPEEEQEVEERIEKGEPNVPGAVHHPLERPAPGAALPSQ